MKKSILTAVIVLMSNAVAYADCTCVGIEFFASNCHTRGTEATKPTCAEAMAELNRKEVYGSVELQYHREYSRECVGLRQATAVTEANCTTK